MPKIEETIEVDVPVQIAYNQWTQFEEFPSFMDGVKEVRQIDDTHLHWVAEVGGHSEEWDAEITEQVPDQRIAWKATSGKPNAGIVTFQRLADQRTKVALELEWEAEGLLEKAGSLVGQDDRQVKGDLKRFKELVERSGTETGGWRGTVPSGTERSGF
jgi:uncharacterized membrane protein